MNNYSQITQSVLVVDDHILFREGLVSLFNSTPDFRVVDQAGSVKDGLDKAFQFKPDIILMDFSLPDGTGLDVTKVVLEKLPDCKIIILAINEASEEIMNAIHLGAKGYVLKNVSSSSLLANLRMLAEDGPVASGKSNKPGMRLKKN